MKKPIDMMLDQVEWELVERDPSESGLPYATHSGILKIGGAELRCYRLNTGVAVFDADDLNAFFVGELDALCKISGLDPTPTKFRT